MTRYVSVVVLMNLALVSAQDGSHIISRESGRFEARRAAADVKQFYLPVLMLDGRLSDGAAAIEQLRADPVYTLDGKPLIDARRDSAVTIGAERSDSNREGFRFVRVWVNDGGQWRIGASHRTKIVAELPDQSSSEKVTRKPTYASASGVGGEVLDAHRLLNEAWWHHDVALYSKHTAPSFVTVNIAGVVRSREEFMRGVGGEQPRALAFSDDTMVRVFGDIAVVGYRHLDVRPDGTPNGGPQWRTRVFVRNAGVWQQVIAQAIRAE